MNSKNIYLLDNEGRVVHTWKPDTNSVHCCYLLQNGHLLRPADLGGRDSSFGGGPGAAGRIQEFTWDGELVWDFKLFNDKQLPHHDIDQDAQRQRPDDRLGQEDRREAIAAGRKKELVSNVPAARLARRGQADRQDHRRGRLGMAPLGPPDPGPRLDQGELRRRGRPPRAGRHQLRRGRHGPGGRCAKKDGAGRKLRQEGRSQAQVDRLRRLGRASRSASTPTGPTSTRWPTTPSSTRSCSASTSSASSGSSTTARRRPRPPATPAASSGKGGDLLYRWGNPRVYRAGTVKPTRSSSPSTTPTGFPKGLPGAGHVLVFNNGRRRPGGAYSSVDEIVLPVDEKGRYTLKEGKAFGPDKAVWSYSAPKKSDFYSSFISGAHRLPNGNTLICSGANGTVFEVTPDKEIVWKYVNPAKGGFGGPGGPAARLGRDQVLAVVPAGRARSLTAGAEEGAGRVPEGSRREARKDADRRAEEAARTGLGPQVLAHRRPGPGGFSLPLAGQLMATTDPDQR